MHISHSKSFNIPDSITLATLAYMINMYEIYFNTTNYPIFNMQDFRYCLWTSILDCFGQLVSPPWCRYFRVSTIIFYQRLQRSGCLRGKQLYLFGGVHSEKSLTRSMLFYSKTCHHQNWVQFVLYINSDWRLLVLTVASKPL